MHQRIYNTTNTEQNSLYQEFFNAIKNNDLEKVKHYLSLGVNINATFNGSSPLISAIENKHQDIAIYLINQGADVNLTDYLGTSPLKHVSMCGNGVLADLLIQKGAKVDEHIEDAKSYLEKSTPLYIACTSGNLDVVKVLVKNKANTNFKTHFNGIVEPTNPLGAAICKNRIEVAKFLIDKGDCELEEAKDPILAFKFGGRAIPIITTTPLILAGYLGNVEVIKALIAKKVNIDSQHELAEAMTALMVAVSAGELEAAKALLENRANPNLKDQSGNTALIYAVKRNDLDLVVALLKSGADISIINLNGKNAIDCAKELEDKTILELLEKVNTYNEKPTKLKYMAAYTCWNIAREVEIDTATETVCQAILRHLGMKDWNIEIPPEMLSLIFDFTLQPNSKVIANEGGQQGEGTSIIKLTPPTRSQICKWVEKIKEEALFEGAMMTNK
jgi:ankyrin repeat protein